MESYDSQGLLHDMFVRQAKKTPDRLAVVSADGRQLTFKELDDVTSTLASYLRLKGVKPDSIVGIYMEKCPEYVISYISILKAGGAYMPMDVSYPAGLLKDILDDARPVAVCADPSLVEFIPGVQNVVIFDKTWKERIKEEIEKNNAQLPTTPPETQLDDLAYTVYSSGTTGQPKGIQCPHRGAVFSYTWRHEAYPYGENEREACNVFFVWEMLRPLLKGVPMYIIPDNVIYDPALLCKFLKKNQITRILFTPSLLEAVVDAQGADIADCLKSMRTIIFCGEVVTVGLFERCIKLLPWVQFVNLYSVSEAHDIACSDLSEWYNKEKENLKSRKFCSVGRVLPNVHVLVMNDDLVPQPLGVPGEIYVGGPTLARGYLNRPQLNKVRFIDTPESLKDKVGGKLYKSGDWGYMLSDGSFEICGRCDSMVKIRGYSIETQAVEAALLDLPMVNACVVLVQGQEGENKYLVVYIVPESKTTKKEVRASLKTRLPFYMIPSYFVFLNSIPILLASGKLDKKALPPVDRNSDHLDEEGQATTNTEKELVPLWAEVLQIGAVDVQESFFDLGGHSLLATKVLNKVQDKFGVALNVKDLFVHSTVSAMGKLIDARRSEDSKESPKSAEPTVDLLKEVDRHDQAVLDMDMQLRAFWRSMQYGDRWNRARILLTGATGFLGAFLLRDLLLNSEMHIFCVVRELPDKKATERVRATLADYGILPLDISKASSDKQLLEAKFRDRVTAIKGDVGLVNMGMSEDDYTYLCTEIDLVIHAAAYVNLIYPYQALHGPNVLGTQNVIRFCCSSKIKPLHYISTNAVFPHGETECSENANMTKYASRLEDGYSQSKWVAEQLVSRVMDRGLPGAIYRLGNLSGDSKEAFWNPQDFTLLVLKGCIHTASCPKVDWDVEMTPVDFVSSTVVSLTQKMGISLRKIFHLVNTKPIKSQWMFEWISAHGYPLKTVDYDNWLQQVLKLDSKDKGIQLLQRLLDTMIRDPSFFTKLSTYKQDNLEQALKTLGTSYPLTDFTLLTTYFSKLSKRRTIPRVRRNTTLDKPLDGQVALVTGASSGIGAAIAQGLAQAGAKVAMGARRLDRLLEQKENIEKDDGVAIAVKCDVTNRGEVKEMVKHTESTLGPVDILVNCAGIMYYTFMKSVKEDEWDVQVDVNCKGVLNGIGAVLDGMVSRGRGHIVNMSSNAGKKGFPGLAVYSGTKFFVEGLSQSMRQELAKTGVKVTCIQPGDVETEIQNNTSDLEARKAYDLSETTDILHSEDISRAVVYAVTQPLYSAVNEILIEPRELPT